MDDLWEIASGEHEHFAREASLARAEADLDGIMPFLYQARSDQEFFHRLAIASPAITTVEARHGLDDGEMTEMAARRYALYREALMEDTDPMISLEPLLQGGGYGSGPEKPLEHDEGPDFSGGYSEVPMGTPGGPDPRVTQVRPPQQQPVTQATGSLRRQADAAPESAMMPSFTPPDLGTGNGSVDVGVGSAAMGGYSPSIPAGMPGGSVAPVGRPVTSSADPVRSRVLRVTAMIAQANPGLPQSECERLGRQVVSRYLRQADMTDSVMGNGPATDSPAGGGSADPGGSGGHSGMAKDMLAGQGLRSMLPKLPGMLPGMGGGAAAGAAAGGEAAGVAEALPLLAAL